MKRGQQSNIHYICIQGNGDEPQLIPSLDLSAIHPVRNREIISPVGNRFLDHCKTTQYLLSRPNIPAAELGVITMHTLEHSAQLMQAVTGNEHDSHAEKIRKERIPVDTRETIMREAKERAEACNNLINNYRVSLNAENSAATHIAFIENAKEMLVSNNIALLNRLHQTETSVPIETITLFHSVHGTTPMEGPSTSVPPVKEKKTATTPPTTDQTVISPKKHWKATIHTNVTTTDNFTLSHG